MKKLFKFVCFHISKYMYYREVKKTYSIFNPYGTLTGLVLSGIAESYGVYRNNMSDKELRGKLITEITRQYSGK